MAVAGTGLVDFISLIVVSWKRWMEIILEPTTGQNKNQGAVMILWERNKRTATVQVHGPQNMVFTYREQKACLEGPMTPSLQMSQSHQHLILGKRGHAHHKPTVKGSMECWWPWQPLSNQGEIQAEGERWQKLALAEVFWGRSLPCGIQTLIYSCRVWFPLECKHYRCPFLKPKRWKAFGKRRIALYPLSASKRGSVKSRRWDVCKKV